MTSVTFKEKLSLFYWYHSFVKWILHLISGRCELERICHNIKCNAKCNFQIEQSLRNSKSEALQSILTKVDGDVNDSVKNVLEVKKINPEGSLVFTDRITKSLKQIIGYYTFVDEVENRKRIPFCSEDKEHEEKLLELWSLLMPDTVLDNRMTTQWSEIGFQGKDPQTDFRGMGILGLENLLYFAKCQNDLARKVLNESHHPKYWYCFAIVGINISELACNLLKSGVLKSHFYNSVDGKPDIEDFHKVYCYLFRKFSSFWLAQKPASVMEFNRVKKEFCGNIITTLQYPETVLEIECCGTNNDGYEGSLQSSASIME